MQSVMCVTRVACVSGVAYGQCVYEVRVEDGVGFVSVLVGVVSQKIARSENVA